MRRNEASEMVLAVTALVGKIARYGVVGVINTLVYYVPYLLLSAVLPYLLAHLISAVPAVALSYFLNCWFTFRARPSLGGLILYPVSNLVNLACTTTALYVLVEFAGASERIAPLLATVAAVPATFMVSQLVITNPIRNTSMQK